MFDELAVSVAQIGIGFVLEQHPHRVEMAVITRQHDQAVTFFVTQIGRQTIL